VSAANQSACAATKAGETPSSSIRAGESCATCRQRCLTLVLHSKLVWYGGWVPISSPPILLVLHSQPPAFACPLSPGQGPMGYDVAMPHAPCSSPSNALSALPTLPAQATAPYRSYPFSLLRLPGGPASGGSWRPQEAPRIYAAACSLLRPAPCCAQLEQSPSSRYV
jgi:hypothetical protein